MERFLRPAGSLVSTVLFTSIAIDGLSFVNQAQANPNSDVSKQTADAEKPDFQANEVSSTPVDSVAPPEAILTQRFAPVPTEVSASAIAASSEVEAVVLGDSQGRSAESDQTSQAQTNQAQTNQAQTNQAQTNQAQTNQPGQAQARPPQISPPQASQNKVAKLADLIEGVQRRITAEEAANILGSAATPVARESLPAESMQAASATDATATEPGDQISTSQASLAVENSTATEESAEAMGEPRLGGQLTAVSDQKHRNQKASNPQGLVAEALNLAEAGQINQARRIVQNAGLLPTVQTSALARINELAAQHQEPSPPNVAATVTESAPTPVAQVQRSPKSVVSLADYPGSMPLTRICAPLALNPTPVQASKAETPKTEAPNADPSKAVADESELGLEAAQLSEKALEPLADLSKAIQPDFSAAIQQYYPFPPNQIAQPKTAEPVDLHLHSLPEIGQRLNTALTSSRLMHSHSVLTRFQIVDSDTSALKSEAASAESTPEKSEIVQLAETTVSSASSDCLVANVSYRDALPPDSQVNLAFPLTIPAAITSMFGWRVHPISGARRFHAGTDFGAPMGTPVLAALPGRVVDAGYMGGYGNAIIIEHPETSQRTLYGHLSTVMVQAGMSVDRGTVIGQVGSTGLSTGPHLHFEVRQLTDDGWSPINPIHPPATTIAQR